MFWMLALVNACAFVFGLHGLLEHACDVCAMRGHVMFGMFAFVGAWVRLCLD